MEPRGDVLISNPAGLSSRLQHLYMSSDMCDIELQVGSTCYNAHKLILCASSDVFKTMLTSKSWTESGKPSVLLKEDKSCEKVFDRFLSYIYTGKLVVSHSSVGPLLMLADKYDIKDLIPLCREFMLENLDASTNSLHVLQWWQIANLQRDSNLMEKTLNYIQLNFSKVIQSAEFISTNAATLNSLLSSSKLVVESELIIFYGIKSWLEYFIERQGHSHTQKDLKNVFHKILGHIRWSMITADELEFLQEDRCVQDFLTTYDLFINRTMDKMQGPSFSVEWGAQTQMFPFLDQPLAIDFDMQSTEDEDKGDGDVMRFTENDLMLCKNGITSRGTFVSEELNLPRVYLNDHWSSALTVSNFTAFPQYGTQTFFFSTPRSGFRHDTEMLDWEVEVHPKGVHFPPAIMIGLESDGNKTVDEAFVNTVRVSVMSRSPQELPLKVEVNILVRASHPSDPTHQYFESCHRKVCIFDSSYQRHNLDGIVPVENVGTYLQPVVDIPELYLSPTVAFTLCMVIRPQC